MALAKKIRFPDTAGIGIKPVSEDGTARLVRAAIEYAITNGRDSVTLVHKGNIMKFTEGAFRDWGYALAKKEYGAEDLDGSKMAKSEAIIRSMTVVERQKPEMIGGSRRKRIAKGSGTSPQDVNQLLNQFKQIKKMMKQFSSPKGQEKMMRMMSQKNGNPFGF